LAESPLPIRVQVWYRLSKTNWFPPLRGEPTFPQMKTSLVVLVVAGLLAGLLDASPTRSLRQRKVEKRRDLSKARAADQAAAQAKTPRTASTQSGAVPQSTPPASPGGAPAPVVKPAPAPRPSGPSLLVRSNKPPASRFFSRVRTDHSRSDEKARKAAAAQQPPVESTTDKKLIYRRTWGTRSRHRLR